MTLFEKLIKDSERYYNGTQHNIILCDICNKPMIIMYGGGWDNDRLLCSDTEDCGVEIEFPTSTIYKENQ
jgi:hypothetical protein